MRRSRRKKPTPRDQRIWLLRRIEHAGERGRTAADLTAEATAINVPQGRRPASIEVVRQRLRELEYRRYILDSGRLRRMSGGEWERVYVHPRYPMTYLQVGEVRRDAEAAEVGGD